MERYEDIDVPEFMKNKTKPVMTREMQEKEIEKAFFKGGLAGIATTFFIIGMMLVIAIIENM